MPRYTNFQTMSPEVEITYEYEPEQRGGRHSPYTAPKVTIVRIESAKIPGVNLLPLMDSVDIGGLRAHLLQCEEDGAGYVTDVEAREVAHG